MLYWIHWIPSATSKLYCSKNQHGCAKYRLRSIHAPGGHHCRWTGGISRTKCETTLLRCYMVRIPDTKQQLRNWTDLNLKISIENIVAEQHDVFSCIKNVLAKRFNVTLGLAMKTMSTIPSPLGSVFTKWLSPYSIAWVSAYWRPFH